MPSDKLALLGGTPAVRSAQENMFRWGKGLTKEHEDAVLKVLHEGSMSNMDITKEFEDQFKKALGRKYALGHNNGTAALQAVGFRESEDEVEVDVAVNPFEFKVIALGKR